MASSIAPASSLTVLPDIMSLDRPSGAERKPGLNSTMRASGSYSGSDRDKGDGATAARGNLGGATDRKASLRTVIVPLIDPPGQDTLKLTLAVPPPVTVTDCGLAPLSQLPANPES
jgi:hypothetical protein